MRYSMYYYLILQLQCTQQNVVDCLLHVVIAVNSVLYFSVSLRQCNAFVSVLRLRAQCRMYTCVVGVWFACIGCGVSIYELYLTPCGLCRRIYHMPETCMSPSTTCSASNYIANVCNNTLSHALHFVGRYIYL